MEEGAKPIKITVVGDGTVGKTYMLSRYAFNQLPADYEPTIFDNYSDDVIVDGKLYNVQLFDTSGQEDYDRLRILSYTDRDCIIICFAVNSRTSFDNVKAKWVSDIRSANRTAKLLLVGTKSDLRGNTEEEQVPPDQGARMTKRIRAKRYMECSALKDEGVQAVFAEAVRMVVRKREKKRRRCELL